MRACRIINVRSLKRGDIVLAIEGEARLCYYLKYLSLVDGSSINCDSYHNSEFCYHNSEFYYQGYSLFKLDHKKLDPKFKDIWSSNLRIFIRLVDGKLNIGG